MKKILASLLVLALCAPAMAVTVDIASDGTVTLDSTEDGVKIVGVALDLSVDGGATVDGLATDPPFNIYPDAGYDLGEGYTYGAGSPAAIIAGPGQATLPLSDVAICFANLNGESTPGADGAFVVSFTVTPSGNTNLTVTENAARGGIVAVDGTSLDISTGGGTAVGAIGGSPECVSSSAAFYQDWLNLGSPACWCYEYNCRGDADGQSAFGGLVPVYNNDLAIFVSAYGQPNASLPAGGECADYDRAAAFGGLVRVYNGDLAILVQNYGQPNSNVSSCPLVGEGGDLNFYVTP